MGKPKVPNTISDKEWTRIRKSAGKQETRDGGMFSKKAVTPAEFTWRDEGADYTEALSALVEWARDHAAEARKRHEGKGESAK